MAKQNGENIIMNRHIISIILENESGALSRVVGLFSQRGYNIESLTVASTENPSMSRMTIQIISDDHTLEQIKKQLNKLIDVVRVNELKKTLCIEKEIMLIKISINKKNIEKIKSIIAQFHGKIIDISLNIYIIQFSSNSDELDNFIIKINKLTLIKEVVRSGIIIISKI